VKETGNGQIKYSNPEIHVRRTRKKQLCMSHTSYWCVSLHDVAVMQNSTVVGICFLLPQRAMDYFKCPITVEIYKE